MMEGQSDALHHINSQL